MSTCLTSWGMKAVGLLKKLDLGSLRLELAIRLLCIGGLELESNLHLLHMSLTEKSLVVVRSIHLLS